jgi:hypothetical protein
MRRWVERSNGLVPLPLRPFFRAALSLRADMIFGKDSIDVIFFEFDEVVAIEESVSLWS